MVTVYGKIYLVDVGAHELTYEGVAADVRVTFSNGKVSLDSVVLAEEEKAFIKSVGSTAKQWTDRIQDDFGDGDQLLDRFVENLDDEEYSKAESYITAYYKAKPMPDAVTKEIPLESFEDVMTRLVGNLEQE